MKPAWDELGDEYADSNSVIIGDVDCTADDTKEICDKIGVKGYPTVKYFTAETPEEGEAYNGGRSVNELKTFVEETLSKHCDIADTLTCTDQEVFLCLLTTAHGAAVSLSSASFETEVRGSGKNGFVKSFAPW